MNKRLFDRSLAPEWVAGLGWGIAEILDLSEICHRARVDPKSLLFPSGRVDSSLVVSVLDHAAAFSRDPLLGLHLAERFGLRGILPALLGMQPTVRDAIGALCRFQHVLGAGRLLLTSPHGPSEKLIAVPPHPAAESRHLSEYFLAAVCRLARSIFRYPTRLGEVGFRHCAAGAPEQYERTLGCRARFGQETDVLVFPAAILDRPMRQPDPAVMNCLQYSLCTSFDVPKGMPFRHEVGLVVRSNLLSAAESDLASTAERLALEPAAVLRKLADERTTYEKIVESVRKELARVLLRATSMSRAEVAARMGFPNEHALTAAFCL